MNLTKTALSLSLLAIMATSGMANAKNSQFTLKVEGTIVPASCDIGNGASAKTVLLGKLQADKLNVDSETLLPSRTVSIDIQCAGLTAVGIQPTDVAEKAGQVNYMGVKAPDAFSLGATADGTVIGGYMVKLNSGETKVDNQGITSFISAPVGSGIWHNVDSSQAISSNGQNMYSWAMGNGQRCDCTCYG